MKRIFSDDSMFDFINTSLLVVVMLVMIYPLYFIVIASFSEPYTVAKGLLTIYPKGLNFDAYKNVFINGEIWVGYKNSVLYTFFGTIYNLALTIPAAYVLTKKRLPGRMILTWYFFLTMYFSGGMIPTYLNLRNLGLTNTPWVLILGTGVSCWNLIVTRQFLTIAVPDELYEAAFMDGATNFKLFFKIALPLSIPILVVMALFYGVGHWNSYYSALLYVTKKNLFPLQLVLRNILIAEQTSLAMIEEIGDDLDALAVAARRAYMVFSMKYALIFIASAPVLAVYPFVQKHFVKGVLIGSIKG